MSKERRELIDTEMDLLTYSAGDMIPMLEKDKKLIHVKQQAFDYYSEKTGEIYQVQVLVTRDGHDFLDAFQTEEMYGYEG